MRYIWEFRDTNLAIGSSTGIKQEIKIQTG